MEQYFVDIASWSVSRAINESSWIFPLVQAFHLVALGFLAGSILMVDLRLLGKGFSQQPLARVARDARPWLIGSLLAMVVTASTLVAAGLCVLPVARCVVRIVAAVGLVTLRRHKIACRYQHGRG